VIVQYVVPIGSNGRSFSLSVYPPFHSLSLKAPVEKAEEELERLHALLQCKTIDYKTGAAHTADGTDRQGDECRVAKLVRRRESKV
jgi:CMP-2-keto-3-deoxyoctulosonic acid synthetase